MAEQLSRLRKIRDQLTTRMETAPDYSVAGIAKTLVEIVNQVEELEAPKREQPKTPLDEVREMMAAQHVPVADDGISQRSV